MFEIWGFLGCGLFPVKILVTSSSLKKTKFFSVFFFSVFSHFLLLFFDFVCQKKNSEKKVFPKNRFGREK
jgi:hypothetical protein